MVTADLETKINQMGNQSIHQSCLSDGFPWSLPDTKALENFLGCQYSMYTVTYQCQDSNVCEFTGKG